MLEKLIHFLENQNPALSKKEGLQVAEAQVELIGNAFFELTKILDALTSGSRIREAYENLDKIKYEKPFSPEVIESAIHESIQGERPETLILHIYKLFLKPGYNPPVNPIELHLHLLALYFAHVSIYPNMKSVPYRVLVMFDHALAQILHQVASVIWISLLKVASGQDKKHVMNIGKKKALMDRDQVVIDTYYHLNPDTRKNLLKKPHTLAGRILKGIAEKNGIKSNELKGKQKDQMRALGHETGISTRTIIRALERNDILPVDKSNGLTIKNTT